MQSLPPSWERTWLPWLTWSNFNQPFLNKTHQFQFGNRSRGKTWGALGCVYTFAYYKHCRITLKHYWEPFIHSLEISLKRNRALQVDIFKLKIIWQDHKLSDFYNVNEAYVRVISLDARKTAHVRAKTSRNEGQNLFIFSTFRRHLENLTTT